MHCCGALTWHGLWHFIRQSLHSYPCFPGRRGMERLQTSHNSELEKGKLNDNQQSIYR